MVSRILKIYRSFPLFKGKLRLGKLLFKKLINKNEPVEFTAKNNIFYKIPNTKENLGTELLINGIYEDDIIDFLKNIIHDGDIYFDIGANIGSIGLPIIKKRANVKYYGFEASPTTFEYLKINLHKNKVKNYKLFNTLIHSDDNQLMKFYITDLYGKSSLFPTYSNQYVIVNSTTIDTFCEKEHLSRINVMKVDVQGFELNVFQGMKQLLLNKKVDNILFEFEDWAEEQACQQIGAAQSFLIDLNYELYDLSGKKLKKILKKGSNMIWAKPMI
jgi:FkbM family methyltransferase